MNKKEYPLYVLQVLDKYLDKQGENFFRVIDRGNVLKYVDRDPLSPFFFVVKKYEMKKDSQLYFTIDHKPNTVKNPNNHEYEIISSQLENHLTNWVNLLDGYEKARTPHDDPIAEAYAKEYFDEFTIIDEDADIKSYPIESVLMIEQHLSEIENGIDEFKTEKNADDIEKIKGDVAELKQNLTNQPKRVVLKKLTSVWGYITKTSLPAAKKFIIEKGKILVSEVGKEVTKVVVKQVIENPTSALQKVVKFFNWL